MVPIAVAPGPFSIANRTRGKKGPAPNDHDVSKAIPGVRYNLPLSSAFIDQAPRFPPLESSTYPTVAPGMFSYST
jgi:hypothetical protein